jgi:hypothetical protein
MAARLDAVKVFSGTRARERSDLGERVTSWIESNPRLEILSAVVALSSDSRFHCLSIVLFCHRRPDEIAR